MICGYDRVLGIRELGLRLIIMNYSLIQISYMLWFNVKFFEN